MLLFACLLVGAAAPNAFTCPELARQEGVPVVCEQGQQGKPEWFQGDFEALLNEAKKSERIVLLDFWTEWCPPCKKLEKETFRDESVLREMGTILCYSVDAESRSGSSLARRYQVRVYPTLIFLDPDGERREQLTGFQAAEDFTRELKRIKRNEGTLSGLRKRVEAQPNDLLARYELALKLKGIEDYRGYVDQINAIKKRDPEGKSLPSRRIKLEKILSKVKTTFDLDPLYEFLDSETESELLFDGWLTIWQYESHLSRSKRGEEAKGHRRKWLSAARSLWPHVPQRYVGRLGNSIAWSLYENRKDLKTADLTFALKVAERAAQAVPDDAAVIDTLACCLFAVGRKEEALRTVERCIELDPRNPEWKKRLNQFRE